MKTTKIISVLSLALIFVTVNPAFSGTIKPGSAEPTVKNIKYQVNVHLAGDLNLCNTYLVQVVDENGLLVAATTDICSRHHQFIIYFSSTSHRYLRTHWMERPKEQPC